MEVLKEVLAEIKPRKEDEAEVKEAVSLFLRHLNKGLRSKGIDAEAILGGSSAKGTWLRGVFDVDIYVRFDYKKYRDKSDELANILDSVLRENFTKIERLHGSRDYFQVKRDKFTFEVVPILKIKSAKEALNITDVSPLHALWVKKHREFADDIRLTKQFCKANGVYGAESYIRGFSGYICEILTIYYKGFMNLVRNAARWKAKEFIDVERHWKNKEDALRNLNVSKIYSPIILIDPVQKDRNAAAALSFEKFEMFRDACRRFLAKPSADFFKVKEITVAELQRRAAGNKLIVLDVDALDGKEDVVGSKLLHAFDFIAKQMRLADFKIYDAGWKWDKEKRASFWYIVDKRMLPETIKIIGPPLNVAHHVAEFKKKHRKTFSEKKRICAEEKREFRNAEDFVRNLIKDEWFKEKVAGIRMIVP